MGRLTWLQYLWLVGVLMEKGRIVEKEEGGKGAMVSRDEEEGAPHREKAHPCFRSIPFDCFLLAR